MSKLAAFAAGAGEGYFGAKRYKDSKARAEKQDELLAAALTGGNASESILPPDVDDDLAKSLGLKRANGGMIGKLPKPMGYAHGGMIGEMPHHHDKMMWQRASFKK